MIDYLIVGSGLAGIAFAETALQNGKSVFVIDANLFRSSKVAAGLYNPLVLKRYSVLSNAQSQLEEMETFYTAIEQKLNCSCFFKLPVLRKFFSAEEQNNWFAAADKPALAPFLSTNLIHKKYSGIDSPFGYGRVKHSGYVNTIVLLDKYQSWLYENGMLSKETFDYGQLVIFDDTIEYQNFKARHIIFAEGFGVHANPFFNELPLEGTKGELLIVKAPGLNLDVILNTNVFILPLGNDLFKIGATYNWDDKTDIPTIAAREELIQRLKEILNCEFEIIDQQAGIRPTVKDRKPLLGTHPTSASLHILNGLGTRGVMLAPSMAKTLFENIEYGTPLPPEVDIRRFDKK